MTPTHKDNNTSKARKETKKRKPSKQVHKGKRVLIRTNDRSYLSQSYLTATAYKRKLLDLRKNNCELAKALENAQVIIADQAKQLSAYQARINDVTKASIRLSEATVKINSAAILLNESVSLMSEALQYSRRAAGEMPEESQITQNLDSLRVLVSDLEPSPTEVEPNRQNFNFPPKLKPNDMSAITEVSVLNEDPKLTPPPLVLEEEFTSHNGVEFPDSLDEKLLTPVRYSRGHRRHSVCLFKKSDEGTEIAANTVPEGECLTPKAPPLLSLQQKAFKSNIPKPTMKARDVRRDTFSIPEPRGPGSSKGNEDQSKTEKCEPEESKPFCNKDTGTKELLGKKRRLTRKSSVATQQQQQCTDGADVPAADANCNEKETGEKKAKLDDFLDDIMNDEAIKVYETNSRRKTFVLQGVVFTGHSGDTSTDKTDAGKNEAGPDPCTVEETKERRQTFTIRKGRTPKSAANGRQSRASAAKLPKGKALTTQDKHVPAEQEVTGNQPLGNGDACMGDVRHPALEFPTESRAAATRISEVNTEASKKPVSGISEGNDKTKSGEHHDTVQAAAAPGSQQEAENAASTKAKPQVCRDDAKTNVKNAVNPPIPAFPLNSTVHNCEDMELTEVVRCPPEAFAIPHPLVPGQDGKLGGNTETTKSSSVAVINDTGSKNTAAYHSDKPAGCKSSDSAKIPGSGDAASSADHRTSKSPTVKASGSQEVSDDASKGTASSKEATEIEEITEKTGDEEMKQTEGKVQGSASTEKVVKSTSVPPPGINDPCCSKSLTPQSQYVGRRRRTQTKKYSHFSNDFYTCFVDSDDSDSDFVPEQLQNKKTKAGQRSSAYMKNSAKKKAPFSALAVKKCSASNRKLSEKAKNFVSLDPQNSQTATSVDSQETNVYDPINVSNDEFLSKDKEKRINSASSQKKLDGEGVGERLRHKDIEVVGVIKKNIKNDEDVAIISEMKGNKRKAGNKGVKKGDNKKSHAVEAELITGIKTEKRVSCHDGKSTVQDPKTLNGPESSSQDAEESDALEDKKRKPVPSRTAASKKVDVKVAVQQALQEEVVGGTANKPLSLYSNKTMPFKNNLEAIVCVADPFALMKDVNCDLIKSDFELKQSESGEVLRIKDKMNDSSVIELPLSEPHRTTKVCMKSFSTCERNKRNSDKENAACDETVTSSKPNGFTVEQISTAASDVGGKDGFRRRHQPVSYKEPNLNAKLRRP